MILGMNNLKKVAGSDEEDDIESLRLAALQSLKRKNEFPECSTLPYNQCSSPEKGNHYRSLKGRNKRGRYFGHQGRVGKNVQFNRVRSTNLISITPVLDEANVEDTVAQKSPASLTLPQEKYSKTSDEQQGIEKEGTSKFSRYNNSDKSESESDVGDISSEDEVTGGKLQRADSLEALMQELDNEIQGKPKEDNQIAEDKPKVKKVKKKKRTVSESELKNQDSKHDSEDLEKNVEEPDKDIKNIQEIETKKKEVAGEISAQPMNLAKIEPIPADVPSPSKRPVRSRSPFSRRAFHRRTNHRNFSNHAINFPLVPPPHVQYGPPPNHFQPHILPFPNQQFNPMFAPPGVIPPQMPMFFDRPLSPLAINTESLTTTTRAPLSPRSAAFVLQNKAIIEKRRRSPRRSYSRSPSRSLSRSPRRSLTPPRRFPRRSISPRRSPRRLSPRRRSLSPNKRSGSPRRVKPPNSDHSPTNRPRVRERLGSGKPNNSGNGNSNRASKEKEVVPQKEVVPLDPVLEARKRKFETNEIGKKGIIRLKPKENKPAEVPVEVPPQPIVEEELEKVDPTKKDTDKDPDEFKELEKLLNEDALLEDDEIVLDQKVEDIFSDDDFASDNEGRFKVKEKANEKVVSLPFTKLVNGAKEEIKSEALPDTRRDTRDRERGGSYCSRFSDRRTRTRSPAGRRESSSRRESHRESKEKPVPKKIESQEKAQVKRRISGKSEKPSPVMDRKFERKIEIKIKNPSKYEKNTKSRSVKKEEEKIQIKNEKVAAVESDCEISVEVEDEDEEMKSDLIFNDSEEEENSAVNDGDLRAQLSRKRAEKLNKLPAQEEVSSRLLQFALQGAVFKKSKKKSRDKSITHSEIAAVREILHADYFSRKFCVACKTERKVRVYKPRYKRRQFKFRYYRRPDGKLPIHLRLGIADQSDTFEDVKVKKKSRKRKNREVLEQV
nr:neurofilament heavy polypeptide-like isoform X2 [Leptinotarsa decemlineata]